MRMIAGLSRPTSGEIMIGQLKPNSTREQTTRLISFFNQRDMLLQSQTVFEVVSFTGIYRGLTSRESRAQTAILLEHFGLTNLSKQLLDHVSGGEAKLTMLAAAFVGRSPIIILDEPTNDLDPMNRWQLWNLVQEYHEKYNTTFLIVSLDNSP
jgi:ABC-2 type transport system ATP-binding protein